MPSLCLFLLCMPWLTEVLAETSGWSLHGQNFSEQRLSPLTQINQESIHELGLAWFFDTGT
ncbi:MAG: hypothetical protein ACPG5J_15895, partial [Pseudomonadales bacterium]